MCTRKIIDSTSPSFLFSAIRVRFARESTTSSDNSSTKFVRTLTLIFWYTLVRGGLGGAFTEHLFGEGGMEILEEPCPVGACLAAAKKSSSRTTVSVSVFYTNSLQFTIASN